MKEKLKSIKQKMEKALIGLLPHDKLLHLVFFGILPAEFLLRMDLSVWQVLVSIFGIGVLKELFDKWLGGRFDWKDVLFGVIGGVLAII